MDSEEHEFLQNSLRKHTEGEHMTYYEKARVGRHFSQDLTESRYDTLKSIAVEQYPAELEKVGNFRSRSFDGFANDVKMDKPVALTEDLLFHMLVYDAIKHDIDSGIEKDTHKNENGVKLKTESMSYNKETRELYDKDGYFVGFADNIDGTFVLDK